MTNRMFMVESKYENIKYSKTKPYAILFWRASDNSEQFPQETYLWNQNHLLFYIRNTQKYLDIQIVRAAFNMKTLLVRIN